MRLSIIASLLIPAAAASQDSPLTHAGWLAGCWEVRAPNRVTREMWMPPLGDLMLGASRTTVGTRTREFEQLRLGVDGDRLVYTSLPSGQRLASFTSVTVTDTLLVFENPSHDFPQRIGYQRRGSDSLLAYIEGPGPNGTRRVSFPMRRADCLIASPPLP
ncbi:MAG TPA: DUF6265 family protein [Gemmatimonadaceae bacterium]